MSSLLREVIPLALTAGAAIVLIVVSTIGVLIGDTGFSTNDTLKAWINLAFGVLLVAVGLRALVRPPKPKRPRPTRNHPASADPSWPARVAWPPTSRPSPSTPRRWP